MATETDIAVVGVGCRFPDAWTPAEYWSNIDQGLVSMRELSDEWLRAAGVPEATLRAADYVRIGTTLPGVAEFAADFFGYTPREASAMDPQQRIFMEACWEALEYAGHPPSDGSLTGVFAGSAAGSYSAARFTLAVNAVGLADAVDDLDLTIGGEPDFLTSRVAYKLGLRGPAVTVQTACSSSLYAVHYASLSLLSGECDIALAGGATVLEPVRGYRYRPDGGQSQDGLCRSFDARATGTTYSSGVGVVALRRLADALADGDPVLAVLRGSAVGNDGAHKAGYAAPSPAGVAAVVRAALRTADVPADLIRYVEAHGTATPLGDQVELAALTEAFRSSTAGTGFCGLGSVKANIGHTGVASSIAGFIKAVHVVRTGAVPPHPAFERPREPGALADSPFYVTTEGRTCADAERHVLVNSIGFGGGNAAAVLAPPPAPARPSAPTGDRVRLLLSARNRVELDALSRALADELDRGEVAVGDVSHTLRVGRRAFGERRVVTARPDQLAEALRLPRPPLVKTVRVQGTASPQPAGPDDEALVDAWFRGADVDWVATGSGHGRRVPLPTYPFTRKRFWALDGVSLSDLSNVRMPPAPTGSVEQDILTMWRELFGNDTIGPDDELGACGGTSLSAVQLVLEIQDRFDVLINVHRAGGSRATVRRMAELVHSLRSDPGQEMPRVDRMDAADDGLVDADLQLPLGRMSTTRARGRDVLLTGAAGFLGAFLLHELLRRTSARIYCVVRAADEVAGLARLRANAARFLLPEPDATRVHAVPGDLRDIGKLGATWRGGELEQWVGHIVHGAARVVFTEPYRIVREDNVLPLAELLTWARGCGIRDFSFVSTSAATAPAMGAEKILETRDQPLDPRLSGYGVSKWVGERLLDRADADGMRVRVFRPGLIMPASTTGAGNDKDLICFVLASGVAVGAHPVDDRAHDMAPVDVVARAIVELAMSPGSVGRAYHLVAEEMVGLRRLFDLLGEAGLPTRPVPLPEWQDLVKQRALATGSPILSTAALLELEGSADGDPAIQATGWQSWLRRTGIEPGVTGGMLRKGLSYLARHSELFGALLPDLAEG